MDATSMETESAAIDNGEVVPADESEDILEEIEKSVRASRGPLRVDGPSGSSGAALPAAVNAGAALLIALAVVLVPRLYDVGERRLVSPESGDSADASVLVRALRREADAQIQEREVTIDVLREQYGKVRDEREALRKNFDSRLKVRADELQDQLRLAIEAERRRLAAIGIADAEAEQKVMILEVRLQSERNAKLEAYSARIQEQTAQRERELRAAEVRYGEELRQRATPLAAEIERLTDQGKAQQAIQRDLERRYEEAEAALKRLEAERSDELAASRHQLQDYKALSARIQAAEAKRSALRYRLEAALSRAEAEAPRMPTDATTQAAMLKLLEAKIEARAVIASDATREAYPGLAERLDRFFLESEKAYRADGRRAGLSEAGRVADELASGISPESIDTVLRAYLEKLLRLLE